MKQGTMISKIVMTLLLLAVGIYLSVSAWNSFTDPFSTVLSYAYTVDKAIETTGFLVREETVIAGQGGIVDLVPAEGERVAKGGTVAYLYQNSAGLDRKNQLRQLQMEREQLEYALQRSDTGGDAAQLGVQVIDAMVTLRASVAQGDLTGLEDETLNLKSLVCKRDYTYGEGGGNESIETAIAAIDGELAALKGQAAQDTTWVSAGQSGVFSGVTDGFEQQLTVAELANYTPAMLDKLATQKPTPVDGAVGKLITDNTWYFVCPLTEGEAGQLVEGYSYTMRFSRDWSGEVDMRVHRIGPPENGRMAVVFSSDRFLSDTTLLRRQTVELVLDSKSGTRVPKAAIRVVDQTITDRETGVERVEAVTGVYALVGAQAEFKPVVILDQREDYCIVQPAPTDSQRASRKALRPGDEIIVAAADLYDGKVVR